MKMLKNKEKSAPFNLSKEIKLLPGYIILILWVAFTAVLLGWVVAASLSTTADIFSGDILGFKTGLHFENYAKAWVSSNVSVFFVNSLIYAVLSCVFIILVCAPYAYVLQRFEFKGRKFLIGLDAAVVVGNPDVITTALIVIPLTILLSVVLPGNRMLPFADLAVVPFRVALVVALTRGNLFKNIIIGLACTGAILLAGTATAPVLTQLAINVGLDLSSSGGTYISSFAATSLTVSYLIYKVFTSNLFISVPILFAVFTGTWYYLEKIKKIRKSSVV